MCMSTIIKILPNSELKYLNISNQKFLVLSEINYCKIPNYVECCFEKAQIIFELKNTNYSSEFQRFVLFIQKWLKRVLKPVIKKILLKGLGLKAFLSSDLKSLELKLGFSHVVKLVIPEKKILSVRIFKNLISASSFNILALSNFLYKIRSLKKPNIYKGKGVWYKNEVRILKTIKKT